MNMQGFLLVCLTAVLTMVSNLMLRAGIRQAGGFRLSGSHFVSNMLRLAREPLFDAGVVFYALAAIVWFRVVSSENLSSSYPVLVGLTFVLITAGAIMLFHEPYSVQKTIGLVLILSGIVLIFRG